MCRLYKDWLDKIYFCIFLSFWKPCSYCLVATCPNVSGFWDLTWVIRAPHHSTYGCPSSNVPTKASFNCWHSLGKTTYASAMLQDVQQFLEEKGSLCWLKEVWHQSVHTPVCHLYKDWLDTVYFHIFLLFSKLCSYCLVATCPNISGFWGLTWVLCFETHHHRKHCCPCSNALTNAFFNCWHGLARSTSAGAMLQDVQLFSEKKWSLWWLKEVRPENIATVACLFYKNWVITISIHTFSSFSKPCSYCFVAACPSVSGFLGFIF